ncbi:hypothetical protein HY990_03325 [Candidatus Micrarchaeota archaeon]|nr:hypothetical protein [Candidatus Micrarchaeota archaeon]
MVNTHRVREEEQPPKSDFSTTVPRRPVASGSMLAQTVPTITTPVAVQSSVTVQQFVDAIFSRDANQIAAMIQSLRENPIECGGEATARARYRFHQQAMTALQRRLEHPVDPTHPMVQLYATYRAHLGRTHSGETGGNVQEFLNALMGAPHTDQTITASRDSRSPTAQVLGAADSASLQPSSNPRMIRLTDQMNRGYSSGIACPTDTDFARDVAHIAGSRRNTSLFMEFREQARFAILGVRQADLAAGRLDPLPPGRGTNQAQWRAPNTYFQWYFTRAPGTAQPDRETLVCFGVLAHILATGLPREPPPLTGYNLGGPQSTNPGSEILPRAVPAWFR